MNKVSTITATILLSLSGLLLAGPANAMPCNGPGCSPTSTTGNHGVGHTPVTICHNGHLITVDDNALKGHEHHTNDLIPAEGQTLTQADCPPAVAEPAPSTTPTTPPTTGTHAGEEPWKTEPLETPGTVNNTPVVVPAQKTAEPSTETYPAPISTPNTVNGAPPVAVQAPVVPAAVVPASEAPTDPIASTATLPAALASTGFENWIYLWGAVGILALIAGIYSVIRARRI